MRECDGGPCGPPILTQTKGYPGERVGPGFGPTRKRPLCPKAEQEETEREDVERVSLPEKRARISTGENFLNMPRHPNATYIFLKSPHPPALFCLLFMNLSNSGRSFPFILSYAELIPCSFKKKSFHFFCCFLLPNQFHLKPAPSPTYPHHPPFYHFLSHLSLCVAASSEKCLILPLSGVRDRSEEEGQPFSLSSLSSGVPLLRLLTLFKAALFFSFHLLSFFPPVWVPFFYFLFLACGIALALPGTGRRVKYPSPVSFRGENSPSVFIALCLCLIFDFPSPFTP